MNTYCVLLIRKGKARKLNNSIKSHVIIMCEKSDETFSKINTPQIKIMWSPEEKQDLSLRNMLRKTENHY